MRPAATHSQPQGAGAARGAGVFGLADFADRRFKHLVIAPAVLVLLLIGVFPIVYTLVVSLQNINMLEEDTSFSGLMNYAQLLHDLRFWQALLHTLIFLAIALPVEVALGLLLAFLFLERMPGRQVFVALLVLPVVISPIIAGATWRLLFDNRFGPINQIVSWFAGEPTPILWVVNPSFVYPAILIAEIWQWTPFMFLLLLAALSNVDKSQLEAAEIDGASFLTTFRKIVLPAIGPVLAIAVLIRGLDLFRIFDAVWQLTRGGPGNKTETLSVFMYIKGFQGFETSYIAALVVVLALLFSALVMAALQRVRLER